MSSNLIVRCKRPRSSWPRNGVSPKYRLGGDRGGLTEVGATVPGLCLFSSLIPRHFQLAAMNSLCTRGLPNHQTAVSSYTRDSGTSAGSAVETHHRLDMPKNLTERKCAAAKALSPIAQSAVALQHIRWQHLLCSTSQEYHPQFSATACPRNTAFF